MSDPTPVLQMLGVADAPVAPESETPVAAEPTATLDADAPEETLDEAMARLDGETAPTDPNAPATAPDDAASDQPETPALTAEQIAELQRQVDEYKAREAQAKAQAERDQFVGAWDQTLDEGYAYYDAERARIQAEGIRQGRTQDEIDLAIYRRVVQGIGLPQGVLGEDEWERQTLNNKAAALAAYESRKTAPSAVEQLAQHYGLDATDRAALAKFTGYPPAALNEIAQTLAAKNQRLTQTHQTIQQTAASNVARRMAQQGITPGTPGQAPVKKPYQFRHTPDVARQENEYLAKRLGLM